MEGIIQKWGNSLAIRIPNLIIKDLKLVKGSKVEISDENGKIVILPKSKFELLDLLNNITAQNLHTEIETGKVTGNEVW